MRTAKVDTETRRGQLAQAALRLIAADGLKGLSVARVARRVGLVPSAVYRHFANKDELLAAVLDLVRSRLQANVMAASGQTPDALECLPRLLMGQAELIRENEGILRVIFSEELHNGHPDRKARVREMVTGYLKRLTEIIARGQQEGSIRADVDPTTVSILFMGLIQPAVILWHLTAGNFDITRHAEKVWTISCEAFRTREKNLAIK
ncbi:MAG: TetR/AcrR family transcriptional regulator [Candidatus Hydrogenedentes bacterium]|nr:TetR/AcrR family transcriptional regulator [Candidatus Hydrogenedentota bacterium]